MTYRIGVKTQNALSEAIKQEAIRVIDAKEYTQVAALQIHLKRFQADWFTKNKICKEIGWQIMAIRRQTTEIASQSIRITPFIAVRVAVF